MFPRIFLWTLSCRKKWNLLKTLPVGLWTQLFVRSQSVVSRRVAGETLIVPVRGKVGDLASIYSFNSTGSLIWQSLESPKCFDELVNVVESEYAVEHDQAEQDVKQFLHDMLAADLVQIREPLQMVG